MPVFQQDVMISAQRYEKRNYILMAESSHHISKEAITLSFSICLLSWGTERKTHCLSVINTSATWRWSFFLISFHRHHENCLRSFKVQWRPPDKRCSGTRQIEVSTFHSTVPRAISGYKDKRAYRPQRTPFPPQHHNQSSFIMPPGSSFPLPSVPTASPSACPSKFAEDVDSL